MGASATRSANEALSPHALRMRIRSGGFVGPTSGQCPGYLQGNLAVLPAAVADDFLRFCTLNPKPCPLLGVGRRGDPMLPGLGADLDIRTDLPGYRIFRDGTLAGEAGDVRDVWRDDLVAFVIGCSFSFEAALLRGGLRLPHIEQDTTVPMYVTGMETKAAGPFGGPMVVSMRSFSPADAISAVLLSGRYPKAHGAPVHFGDPAAIGISDLSKPDFGDAPDVQPGHVPVFWACGVTPQMAIRRARPDFAITHEPGYMLVTDLLADEVR